MSTDDKSSQDDGERTEEEGCGPIASSTSVLASKAKRARGDLGTSAVSQLRRRLSLRPAGPQGEGRRIHSLSRSASLTVADFTSQWCEVFRMFDVNLDGLVSCDELGSKMRSLGCNVTQSEVEDLIHEWDKDQKSALSLTEFTLMMSSSRFQSTPMFSPLSSPTCRAAEAAAGDPIGRDTGEMLELKAAFDLFDRDKNGLLDTAEVKTALELIGESLTDREIDYIVSEADTDKDGAVSFREFCDIILGRSLSPMSPFYFHGRSASQRRKEDEERRVRMEYQADHVSMRDG